MLLIIVACLFRNENTATRSWNFKDFISERNKGRDSNPYSSDRNTLYSIFWSLRKDLFGCIQTHCHLLDVHEYVYSSSRSAPSQHKPILHNIIPLQPIIIPIIKTQLLPHLNIPTRHKPNSWLPIITLMNTLRITIILWWRSMI